MERRRPGDLFRKFRASIRQLTALPEISPVTPPYTVFPMEGIRNEFNQWKSQFSMGVTSDTMSQYETHRTSEIFGVGFHVRLLTNIIASRVQEHPATASYNTFEVEFYQGQEPQQCIYTMTRTPRLITMDLDGTFYQMGEELRIAPEGEPSLLRALSTEELKVLQARLNEIVDISDNIHVSEPPAPSQP